MIYCTNDRGQIVSVAPGALQYHPAAYGILIDDLAQVLLLQQAQTGLWYPPGGVLAPEQTPHDAVRYLFRQATGITPQIVSLVYVEDRYLADEAGQAFHLSALYYRLQKSALTAVSPGDGSPETAAFRWLTIHDLQPSHFLFGWEAVRAARLHQTTSIRS